MPTAIHSVRRPVTEFEEPREIVGVPYFKSANERVSCICQLVISRIRLPKRFPVGTTYVVEGRGGEHGDLRVFSRYVVLPGGQRINLVDDPCGNFAGPASPSGAPPWRGEPQWNSARVKSAASQGKENYGRPERPASARR